MHKATKFEGAKVSSDNFPLKPANSHEFPPDSLDNSSQRIGIAAPLSLRISAGRSPDPAGSDCNFRKRCQISSGSSSPSACILPATPSRSAPKTPAVPLPFPPGSPVSCKAGRSLRPTVKTKAAATFSFPASALPPFALFLCRKRRNTSCGRKKFVLSYQLVNANQLSGGSE